MTKAVGLTGGGVNPGFAGGQSRLEMSENQPRDSNPCGEEINPSPREDTKDN